MNQKGTLMITAPILAMVLLSVACSALAQLSLKHGMSQPVTQQALAAGDWLVTVWAIASNLFVLGGLFLYGFGAVVWLFVLARLDVSVAYPFVALGFLITLAMGCLLFGEALTLSKVAGTLLVALGVYLVASS